MSEVKKKETQAAGMVSVVIMFMLTVLGVYSVKKVNNLAHSDNCSIEGPALWAIGNFYVSIIGGAIAFAYEFYLVIIDKTFEEETIPVVPKIRAFNAGYIFTAGFIFDAFMVLGTTDAKKLNMVVFALAIAGTLVAPGMAFPGTKDKAGPSFFAATFISMICILVFGSAHGGTQTKLLLAGNKLASVVGLIVTPPSGGLRKSTQFHILRFTANCMVIASYLKAQSESPCFPQEAEAQVSSMLLPTLGASICVGWILHLNLASKSQKVTERTYLFTEPNKK